MAEDRAAVDGVTHARALASGYNGQQEGLIGYYESTLMLDATRRGCE